MVGKFQLFLDGIVTKFGFGDWFCDCAVRLKRGQMAILYSVSFLLAATPSMACHIDPAQQASLDFASESCINDYAGVWEGTYYYNYGTPYMNYTCTNGGGVVSYFTGLHCPTRPVEPPTSMAPSPTTANSCPIKGSVIRPESRVIEENISIAGTGYTLNYSSDRAFGYSSNRYKHVNTYVGECLALRTRHETGGGSPLPPECQSRDVRIEVAGRVFNPTVVNSNPAGYQFFWDGLDASGNFTSGSGLAKFTITDIPADVNEVPATYSQPIGSFYSIIIGLGGWTISPVHFYDVHQATVFRGDGSKFKTLSAALSGGTYSVPSSDASEVYVFDSTGRHLQTKTGIKGTVILTMTYVAGKISTITDAFSNVTTVNYISNKPVSIVGPFGHTTTLATDADGYLTAVTSPSAETFNMTYYSGAAKGLLQNFQKPKGIVTSLSYDSFGLLTYDSSSAGSSLSLLSTFPDVVEATSDLGIKTEYLRSITSLGATTLTKTGPGAMNSTFTHSVTPDGILQYIQGTDNIGVTLYDNKTADPRFPSVFETNNFTQQTSSYLRSFAVTKAATLSNPDDPFSVVDLTETTVLNSSKTTTSAYLSSTSKFTRTSPVGRKNYVTVDSFERPISTQFATYAPVTVSYDTRGRVSTVAQGTSRTSTFTYDSSGNLQSITNPLSQTKTFGYDSSGRVTSETFPDSRVISYAYDLNGNLASVTPPGGLAHSFVSNGFDLIGKYTSPAVSFFGVEVPAKKVSSKLATIYNSAIQWAAEFLRTFLPEASSKVRRLLVNRDTDYFYDNDRKLTSVVRPDGATASFTYSATSGRLDGIVTPLGNYVINQNSYYSYIDSVVSPDGVTQTFSHDGPFLMSAINSGATSGSVYFTYNNEFQLASSKVNTATTLNYVYDNDGLVTTAGNQTITRSTTTGFPTKTTLSTANENYTYSTSFGELASIQGKYGTTTNIYQSVLTRDDLSRIVQKVETVGVLASNTYAYTFDSSGRLTTVLKNSAPHSAYVYDSNSNRTSVTRNGTTLTATFDEQDRIVTFGTKTYAHNDAGEVLSITDTSTAPSSVTTYTYDVFGNLKSVSLPNSTVISYVLDGQNRRVGKKVGVTLQKQFVWFDQLRPAAELNGTGAIVSQFVYGIKGNVPDYIIKGSVRYKLMTDHLGSVVAVVHSTNGTVAQRIEYDEFGRVLSDTSPGFQPFGFAGGIYDSDTGLVLFGARTYDAETGRWLSKDPILFAGGDTNLYGYVMNDPINLVDPSGLSQKEVDFAMGWIRRNRPDLVKGIGGVKATATNLLPSGTTGFTLPGRILIDSAASDNQSNAIYLVAHELQHAQRGVLNTILFQTQAEHDSIYTNAFRVQDLYDSQQSNPSCR